MEEDCSENASQVGHACNSCRKRKLRCSRELPTCQHCRKSASECFYETKRGKPGMKAGALESIHRRLDALEQSVGRQQATLNSLEQEERLQDDDSKIQIILSTLATSLQTLNKRSRFTRPDSQDQNRTPTKRRRIVNPDEDEASPLSVAPLWPDDIALSHLLESYFTYIHPWTPIIHEGRLRRRLENDAERDKLYLVIQAMTLVASRHIVDNDMTAILERSRKHREDVRDWLVSKALKQPSVENLQALVIIASEDIGNGQVSWAWPLVGSISRMVEYLQLTVEVDEAVQYSFSQPYKYLSLPQDWIEAEERRRVFWSVFALDRFCSVSMGWNTSLTADDVQRRLPCDGIAWRKGDPVVTPYFGIWDKSAGRIGNPIAFLPTHPVSVRTAADDGGDTLSETGTSPGATAAVDMSTVGAFAYCIEATESMSRVTSYFLQQKVNLNDQKEFTAWLTRFKELDIRLVHWKMLLPKKWAVSVVQQASSRMDPNLTLAHVTHNASMILLHQPIAFPLPEWPFRSRLPSICSIETCQTAAVEVASITNQYLKHSPAASPLSSQFAFCVFVAARTLILSWNHNATQTSVASEFWILIQNLDMMSSRWAGSHHNKQSGENLAAKYSSTLNALHRRCSQNESFSITISGYTTEMMQLDKLTPRLGDTQESPIRLSEAPSNRVQSATEDLQTYIPAQERNGGRNAASRPQASASQRMPVMTPDAFSFNAERAAEYTGIPTPLRPGSYNRLSIPAVESMEIPQMLLDQQFTDLDRVITYNDGLFGSDLEAQRW
ncbi:fungal-specific transcription factor domain-containing protein [Aspergillus floccosus]